MYSVWGRGGGHAIVLPRPSNEFGRTHSNKWVFVMNSGHHRGVTTSFHESFIVRLLLNSESRFSETVDNENHQILIGVETKRLF